MRFTCEKSTLVSAISVASRTVAQKAHFRPLKVSIARPVWTSS